MASQLNINYRALAALISEAKTAEVFDILIKELSDQPTYTDYLKEVILLSQNFEQLERARRIDIVGFQDYRTQSNQISNALLELLEDLKTEKAYRPHKMPTLSLSFWNVAALLSLATLLFMGGIGFAAYYFFGKKEPPIAEWKCPPFNTPSFKVLVLPFHKELPEGRVAPHKLIVSQLADFSNQENLAVRIGTILPDGIITAVANEQEVKSYVQACEPDLIIWGQVDIVEAATGITLHYSLTNPGEFKRLSDFEVAGKIDTVFQGALVSSSFKGALGEIEQLLKHLLKVVVAFYSEDYLTVVKGGRPIISPEVALQADTSVLICYMKAESYLKTDQPEKAIDCYTTILEREPTSGLALNNRAHLQLNQKQLEAALTDFNTLEILDKADYEVYYKKAEIHEQLGNLGAAKKEYARAKAISPPDRKKVIEHQINQVEKKIIEKKDRISREKRQAPAHSSTRSTVPNPRKPQLSKQARAKELLNEAIDDNVIGEVAEAEAKAVEILQNDPDNEYALRELIRSKYFQDNTITITDLQKTPYLKQIDAGMLKKLNDPVLNVIIQNEKITRKRQRPFKE